MGWFSGIVNKVGAKVSSTIHKVASVGRKVADTVGSVAQKVHDVSQKATKVLDVANKVVSGVPILGSAVGIADKIATGLTAGSGLVADSSKSVSRGLDRADAIGQSVSKTASALASGNVSGAWYCERC